MLIFTQVARLSALVPFLDLGEVPLTMVMQWCARWLHVFFQGSDSVAMTVKTEQESNCPSQEQSNNAKVKRRRPISVNET